MNKERKTSWLKRGFALFLAAATLLATSGLNPGAKAEETGEVPAGSGTSITQVFKANPGSGKSITVSSFSLPITIHGDNYSIDYDVYENFPLGDGGSLDGASPFGGASVFSNGVFASADGPTTISLPVPDLQFADGESYAVRVVVSGGSFSFSPASGAGLFVDDGLYGDVGGKALITSNYTTSDNEPTDVEGITLSAENYIDINSKKYVTIDKGSTLQLNAELEGAEGKSRRVSYSSATPGVASIDDTGLITAKTPGTAVITASSGATSDTIDVNVVETTFPENKEYFYNGEKQQPGTTNTDLTVAGMGAKVESDDEDGYRLSYSGNTKDLGEKTVTVTGCGIYGGYSKELTYTIEQLDISTMDPSAASVMIGSDGRVSSVTGFGRLSYPDDFTAEATLKGYNSTDRKGTYDVKFTGQKNCIGTVTKTGVERTFSSDDKADINGILDITLEKEAYAYTTSQIKPKYTARIKNTSDAITDINSIVTVTWGDNVNVGEGTITFTGKESKGYTGSITKTFTIEECDIARAFSTNEPDLGTLGIAMKNGHEVQGTNGNYTLTGYYRYTGSEINPWRDMTTFQLVVGKDGDDNLTFYDMVENRDYRIDYEGAKGVGTHNLIIEGMGNFVGTVMIKFEIAGDLEKATTVNLERVNYIPSKATVVNGRTTYRTEYKPVYSGSDIKPIPSLSINGLTVSPSEYTLSWDNDGDPTTEADMKSAGEKTITVTGNTDGKYAGQKIDIVYEIVKKDISNATIEVDPDAYVYNTEAIKPGRDEVTVKLGGQTLDFDTDYDLTYKNNINNGTAKVTATGKGNYTGTTVAADYKINKLSITNNSQIIFTYKDSWEVTGAPIEPPVSITYRRADGQIFTIPESDYTLAYYSNVKTSNTAPYIKVTGTNNLTGSKTLRFSITTRKFEDLTIKVDGQPAAVDAVDKSLYKSSYTATYKAGTNNKPPLEITDSEGNVLRPSIDYVPSYNASNVGTATVRINGNGSYKGSSVKVEFQVLPKPIGDPEIKVKSARAGTDNVPELTIQDTTLGTGFEKNLVAGTDYYVTDNAGKEEGDSVTWPEKAGIYSCVVVGKGNYTGTIADVKYQVGENLADLGLKIRLVNPKMKNADGSPAVIYCDTGDAGFAGNVKVPYLGATADDVPEVDVYRYAVGDFDSDNYKVDYIATGGANNVTGQEVTVKLTAKAGSTRYFSTDDKEVTLKYTVKPIVITDTTCQDRGSIAADHPYYDAITNQGMIIIDNTGETDSSYSGSSMNYNFAHQTALAVKPAVYYYPYGREYDPITLVKDTDYAFTPASLNAETGMSDGLRPRAIEVTIAGKGKIYTGNRRGIFYHFKRVDINDATLTLKNGSHAITLNDTDPRFSVEFTGEDITLTSELNAYGAGLIPSRDYNLILVKKVGAAEAGLISGTDYRITVNGNVLTIVIANTANTGNGTYVLKYAGTGTKHGTDAGQVSNEDEALTTNGNYYGEMNVQFKIAERTIENATIEPNPIPEQTYTGEEVRPVIALYENEKLLTPTVDYVLTYTANVNPGEATITATGKNHYTGTKDFRFNIIGDISDDSLFEAQINNDKVDEITGKFTAEKIQDFLDDLEIVNTKTGAALTLNDDYTVSTAGLKSPGVGNIVITGKGKYKGTIKIKNSMTGDLSSAELVVRDNQDYYTYTGDDINPNITVTARYDGKSVELTADDYKIVKSEVVTNRVGPHSYKIVGQNTYAGTEKSGFTFYVKYNLAQAKIKFKNEAGTFVDNYSAEANGAEQRPQIQVLMPVGDSYVEVENTPDNYSVDYANNVNPGVASVYAIAPTVSDYSTGRTPSATFEITSKKLTDSNLTVTFATPPAGGYVYTGEAVNPAVESVKYNNRLLTEGRDYKVSYGENINAGQDDLGGKVEITGIGEYTGTVRKNFTINQVEIDPARNAKMTFEFTNPEYAGVGTEVHPTITEFSYAYDGTSTRTLEEGKDYTVRMAYTDANNLAGVVTITGKGNYKGTITKNVTVQDRNIATSGSIEINNQTFEYNGAAPSLDLKLVCRLGYIPENKTEEATYTLKKGVDYDITTLDGSTEYSDYNVGTYPYLITAKAGSHFTGQLRIEVEIVPRDISNQTDTRAKVLDNDESPVNFETLGKKEYTGSPITFNEDAMRVECKLKADNDTWTKLNSKIDFNVTGFSNNTNAGIATVTIQGSGNYTGSRNVEFGIGDDIASISNVALKLTGYDYLGKVVDGRVDGEAEEGDTNAYASYWYDGVDKTPGTELKINNVKKTLNRDYKVTSYKSVDAEGNESNDLANVGKKQITITGTGAYYGTITKDYYVTERDAAQDSLVVELNLRKDSSGNYFTTYTGRAIEPEVTAVYNDTIDPRHTRNLLGTDCTVTGYTNNVNVTDDATVELKLKHNYKTQTVYGKFRIAAIDIADCDIALGKAVLNDGTEVPSESGSTYTYNYSYQKGKEIRPEVILSYNGAKVDFSDEDLKIVYADSYNEDKAVNPGEAKVIVSARTKAEGGSGNYSGEKSQAFAIYADLSQDGVVEAAIPDQFYFGNDRFNPLAEVKVGEAELVKDVDYSMIELPLSADRATGYVQLTGNAPFYTGTSAPIPFNVSTDAKDLLVKEAAEGNPEYVYNGNEIKPEFTLLLPNGEEYHPEGGTNIEYARVQTEGDSKKADNLKDAGTFKAVIRFMCAGKDLEKEVEYRIVPADLGESFINFTLVKHFIYDRKPQETDPYIRDLGTGRPGTVLAKGTDYTVKFTDLDSGKDVTSIVNPGNYKVTAVGNGNYGGTREQNIEVVPDGMHSLSVEYTTTSSVKLKWTRCHDVTGYLITSETGAEYGRTASDNFVVSGLAEGRDYNFTVTPYVQKSTKLSTGKSMSAVAVTRPKAASGAAASSSSSGTINISWNKSSNVDGYEIYRSATQNGSYQLAAVVPKNSGAFVDTMVKSGSTYYYKLRSYKKVNGQLIYGDFTAAIRATTK